MAGVIFDFGEPKAKAMFLVDLAEPANEAKSEKRLGLRLERSARHCVVARSLRVREGHARHSHLALPGTPLHHSGN